MKNSKQDKKIHPRVKKALRRFGLSDNEILVYLATLNHEETSPFAVSRETGIARTTVYDVLTGLSLKGLVKLEQSDGFSKQQTRIRAANPSKLRSILTKRRQELVRNEIDILEILPMLKDSYHGDESSADFQFLPGIEGARKVYEAELNYAGDASTWENLMPMDVFGMKEMNVGTQKMTDRNLKARSNYREIIPGTDWARHVMTYQVGKDLDYLKARNIRVLETPLFDNKLYMSLHDNRVHVVCAYQEEAWAMVIKSEVFTKTMQAMYEVVWQMARPVTAELVKSWGENEFLREELGK